MVVMTMERGPKTAIKAKFPFIVGAVSVGTLLEWYGFYLYSGLAGVLSAQFFPNGWDHGVLYSIGIFWTGFAIRPVGAVVLGGLAVASDGQVDALHSSVRSAGPERIVTVSHAGRSIRFTLRRGNEVELSEFAPPPTPWRIDAGVDRLH